MPTRIDEAVLALLLLGLHDKYGSVWKSFDLIPHGVGLQGLSVLTGFFVDVGKIPISANSIRALAPP